MALLLAAATVFFPTTVIARPYPLQSIRFVVPFPSAGTPQQCREYLRAEYAKFGRPIKAAGIKGEAGG